MIVNVLGSLTLIDQSIDWTQIYDDKLHQYRRVVAELVGNLATESGYQSPANHFEREKGLNRLSSNMSRYWLMVYSQKLENGNYINAIKLVRNLTGRGLKESRDFVAGSELTGCYSDEAVENFRRLMTELGAEVIVVAKVALEP